MNYILGLDLPGPILDYILSIPEDFMAAGVSLWLVFLFIAIGLCVLIYLWARRENEQD